MSIVPRDLYTKEIKRCIDDLILFCDAKDFYSLDEIHQNELVALGIKAFGCDIDIVIGSEANLYLANLLTSSDRDNEIELIRCIKESAREKLCSYFDYMIQEELTDRLANSFYTKIPRYIDLIKNGEVRYL